MSDSSDTGSSQEVERAASGGAGVDTSDLPVRDPKDEGDPTDQRRHPRYDVEGVKGSLRLSVDAKVLNMSLDGMALETRSWLAPGRRYSFKLHEDGEEVRLEGEVVWSNLVRTARDERGEAAPIYRAGVEFGDILSDTARRVRDFIEHNAVVKLESTRLFGRFRMPDKQAGVDLEQELQVRRVSFSGMLIEADFRPELEDRFEVDLHLGDEEESLSLTVRVAHVRELDDPDLPATEIGVEFLDLAEQAQERLARLMGQPG